MIFKNAFSLSLVAGFASLIALSSAAAADEEIPLDPLTGLKMAPGWEMVRNNCITCHSAKQFLQQRGTRATWDHVITWMQERSGLWPLDAETRGTILDYLATQHGPGDSFRRPPIPADLMPPNPYATAARKEYEEKKKAGQVK